MRWLRTLAAASALLAAAGCGIKPTEVIESGRSATITIDSEKESRPPLVFLVDKGGRLAPVHRLRTPPPSVPDLLRLLTAGPTDLERAAGLRSELPAEERVAPVIELVQEATMQIRLRVPVEELTTVALRQLVCTFAFATSQDGLGPVLVAGPDGKASAHRCDEAAD
ncbi:hypothetical protein [Streptomyces sp. NPDC051211]|uniref:hypothetical protein n=1 Tax=Streptomyces sp. NPDC051211 TaxID=3154643 RepID=UPI00345066AB